MQSPQLKYKEVEKELRQLARTLPIGAKIPPERHLATSYNCNFLTVRKALKSLVDEGIIVRRVGSGSFIAKHESPDDTTSPYREKHIGLLVYNKSNAYAQKLLLTLAHAASEADITLSSAWINDFSEDALRQAQSLADRGCSSILLPWFPLELSNTLRDFLTRSPLPLTLPIALQGFEQSYFGTPETFGVRLRASIEKPLRYLTLLGRTRVAFLGPSSRENPVLEKMLIAYTSYVSSQSLENLAYLAAPGNASMDSIAQVWGAHCGQLGVMCYDDEHALRLLTAMHKAGLKAPDDIAIIGFNDTEASHYSDPPLSTIVQDFEDISRKLLRKALAQSAGTPCHTESPLTSQIIVRGSCGGKGRITAAMRRELGDFEICEDSD